MTSTGVVFERDGTSQGLAEAGVAPLAFARQVSNKEEEQFHHNETC